MEKATQCDCYTELHLHNAIST